MEYRICPSILAADFMHMGEAIGVLRQVGCAHLHMDIMDGCFVPQITFGEKMVKDARKIFAGTIDCHLMIANPWDQIVRMIAAGSDIVILHYESFPSIDDLVQCLEQIDKMGKKAGLALDGPTADLSFLGSILTSLEVVLVATGKVGKAGQEIQIACLEKVRQIRDMQLGKDINIMVDIGINNHTIEQAKQAGANWFVASSAIFGHTGGIEQGYLELVAKIAS